MKWKKTLTAEEITLHVMGMDSYYYFNPNDGLLETHPPSPRYQPKKNDLTEIDEPKELRSSEQVLSETLDRQIEAQSIYKALIDELYLVDPYNEFIDERVLKDTHLVIAARAQVCEEETYLAPHLTTVTKESAALWFCHMGDTEKARLLIPNFNPQNQIDNELLKLNEESSHPKRENEKPFQLIKQLVEMLMPDQDLSKSSQVHAALNRKLKGDKLAVSVGTLEKYLLRN